MLNKQNILNLSRLYLFTLGLSLINLSSAYAGRMYKWIDENGQIRYSDRLPIEQTKKRHQMLAPDGRILQTREASTPSAQLKQEREEQKRLQQEAQKKAAEEAFIKSKQSQSDRVLMMTFGSEAEILDARSERVAVIDSVILLLQKNIEQEHVNRENLEQTAKKFYYDKGREVPGGLAQKLEYSLEKILAKQGQLISKTEERAKIKKQYAVDLIRYQQLSKQ